MDDWGRVLVVGTTPDYIQWIDHARPGQVLFLTDGNLRQLASEPRPAPEEEICCDLSNFQEAQRLLAEHLARHRLVLTGVCGFDCESLPLAAWLAAIHRLPYPGTEAVHTSRDKFLCKKLWRAAGIRCPAVHRISSTEDAAKVFRDSGTPLVLKPHNGSGSELVFHCRDENECREAASLIKRELAARQRLSMPLYRDGSSILAEEWISGREYSCDFYLSQGRARIIRLTRKIARPRAPMGTAMAYILLDPDQPPQGLERAFLEPYLYAAAQSLGLNNAICMVDLLYSETGPCLLEMTPRPGGDCIPHLLRQACDFDMLLRTVEFASDQSAIPLPLLHQAPHAGLRLHATRDGLLQGIDVSKLTGDPSVLELHLLRTPGHRITLPPADYDSWYLGYCIIRLDPGLDSEAQCLHMDKLIIPEIA